MLLTTGVAVPLLLAHTSLIAPAAAGLSLAGGALIYGTSTCSKSHPVITYAAFFHTPDDEL